ncbi:MAG TPA: GcrA family cell cycle regulator [Rhizobium sp.]
MLKQPFSWTDQNVATLKEMLSKGHSASQAGARLGCSKNAALSKAFRMGFSFKGGNIVARIDARAEDRKATRVTQVWTEEELARASKLWADNKTAGQIGFAIGKSVHAVNCKTQDRRDLFPFRHRTTGQKNAASAHAKALNRVMRGREERRSDAPEPPPADYDTSVFEMEACHGAPTSRRLQLTELTEQTCKWPVGDPLKDDFHFCGVRSGDGSPFCSFHHRLAYRPREMAIGGGRRA